MRIREPLQFFAALKNVDRAEVDGQVDLWLERVKLSEWKQKKASELSKGMQQKVQFVTAVLHEPESVDS